MSSRRKSSSMAPPKDQTRLKIERMEADREARRKAMVERKTRRDEEQQRNIAEGNPGDVDFIGMVRRWREEHADDAQLHDLDPTGTHPRICICVRKRPITDRERARNDHDSVTCLNPQVWIHTAKLRVDGITKYLDHTSFQFDHAFHEDISTENVYKYTTMPLIDFVCRGIGGRATVFAYGQTGSGKTYTMNGIQRILCHDLFLMLEGAPMSLNGGSSSSKNSNINETSCTLDDTVIMVSFFEMYGGFIQDLLNERQRLKVLEDGTGEIVITGLQEVEAKDPGQFLEIVDKGNNERTTHITEANDTSSRSHAICQIILRDRMSGKLRGKLSLVDLAGSERGSDTKSHNSQRRTESAEINTSLLALKECIRALDRNVKGSRHVPYRASKLTLILKDCFTSDRAMTTMIATVSPGASAADHSINTLRYADRIKEKKAVGAVGPEVISPVPQIQSRGVSKGAIVQHDDLSELAFATIDDPVSLMDHASVQPPPESVTPGHEPNGEEGVFADIEEQILNMHMGFIAENARLLTQEGSLLQEIQCVDVSAEEIDQYVTELESILDQKEDMILALQEKISVYRIEAG